MENVVELDMWALHGNDNPYTPPELATMQLSGTAKGHPAYPDAPHRIITGTVISIDGEIVSSSRTTYKLLEPNPEFVFWRQQQGLQTTREALLGSVGVAVHRNRAIKGLPELK